MRPRTPLRLEPLRASLFRFACAMAFCLTSACSPGAPAESERSAKLQSENGPPAVSAAAPETEAAVAPTAQKVPYRGLWVLCEGSRRVLEDPERVGVLIDHAINMEVTDLFVQVYRGGRAWFDSSHADAAPYRAIVERTGSDPLKDLIARAHGAGLRVHAWVNVLSLNRNRGAPIVLKLGSPAIHVDARGRSILDYPEGYDLPSPDSAWYRAGTPGLYLDPAAPGVADELVETFRELVTRYPALDGLHLDYIRHPGVLPFAPGSRFGVGLDFGYGAETRKRFRRETGLRGPYRDPAVADPSRIVNANRWDAWRREKVTELVSRIGEASEAAHPGLRISAAVIAYVDRAYLSLAQDWRRWLEDGLIDFAVPMVYSTDDRLFRYQVEDFARGPQADRVWPGIGVWLFEKQPERALRQIEITREAGAVGDALFSYDSIADSSEGHAGAGAGAQTLLGALVRGVRDTPAAPATEAHERAP